ncbi:hypothetical protein ACFS07_11560 [Undibacterium arcticum]
MSTHPFLMQAAEAYTSVIRGIPDLVMMLLIFLWCAGSGELSHRVGGRRRQLRPESFFWRAR